MAERTTTYSDIHTGFKVHPVTGDLLLSKDDDAIRQSLSTLLKTGAYDRVKRPDISSGIQDLLFEPMDNITHARLMEAITTTVNLFEPRAILRDIQLKPEPNENRYSLTIVFTPVGLTADAVFETFLYRA